MKDNLNESQRRVFDFVVNNENKNVFITGGAGVGKSFTLEVIVNELKKKKEEVLVVAPTGISAFNVGGITIHKAFKLPFNEVTLSEKNMKNIRKYATLIKKITTLVIEEISMVSRYHIDMIEFILKDLHDEALPFGGIRVIFMGDFVQLPPIVKIWRDDLDKGKPYAFYSKSWTKDIETFYLTEKVRQKEGDKLALALDKIREGDEVGANAILSERLGLEPPKNATVLYTTNVDVEAENSMRLAELNTKEVNLKAQHNLDERELKSVLSSSLVMQELILKEGAEIIFIKNDKGGEYYNGKRGKILSVSSRSITVLCGEQKIFVDRDEFIVSGDDDESTSSFKQFPIKLAYAMTVHKTQGMTINGDVIIDLSRCFIEGLGYVSLSRATKFNHIYLAGLGKGALSINPLICKVIEPRLKKLGSS